MIGLDCLLRLANIPIILFSAEVPFTKYDFVDDVDGKDEQGEQLKLDFNNDVDQILEMSIMLTIVYCRC